MNVIEGQLLCVIQQLLPELSRKKKTQQTWRGNQVFFTHIKQNDQR